MSVTPSDSSAQKLTPYNLRWIYGYNPKVAPLDLSTNKECIIFYAATNCGVIYNWNTDQMKMLQGHSNSITCIGADAKGKWLFTADSGPDNILTIWDSNLTPCRTIFSPHGNVKLCKVALSADAKYLLTVALHDTLILRWWIWSFGLEVPHAELAVEASEHLLMVRFNPTNSEQFFLMSKHNVWVGESKKIIIDVKDRVSGGSDHYYALRVIKLLPPTSLELATYKTFEYLPNTSQVLTVTSGGGVVIFGYTMEVNYNADSSVIDKMKFVKALRLDSCKITVVKFVDNIIVTGNENGEVKFYDDQLKLLYWCHRLNVDSIRGLSFHLESKKYTLLDPKCRQFCECVAHVSANRNSLTGEETEKLMKYKTPADATPKDEPFIFRDFIIQTDNLGIAYADFVHEKYSTILDYRKPVTNAISVHPEKPLFCIGFANGTLESVNFNTHKILSRTDLRDKFKVVIPPKDDSIHSAFDVKLPLISVSCLQYSPSGAHLACGLNNGQLLFLDPISIQILDDQHHDAFNRIIMITYSCDSLMLASADKDNTVCVYKFNCKTFRWKFIGKSRNHFKNVTSIIFTSRKNEDTYRLFSFGLDKYMLEYSIEEASLDVLKMQKIDMTAGTLCAIEWPTPKKAKTDFPAILVTDTDYKYKIINSDTAVNRGQYLGPRFEQPVDKMILVQTGNYLLFATKTNIGIQKLPLDGNPYKHIAVLCHPKKIINVCHREDMNILFVLGENDNCILEWEPNYRSVDKTTEMGGLNLVPYYPIIEGGKNGWLFHEMRDLFYYIQLLYQGTYLSTTRTVGDYIPVEALPDIMRALGFFPSQFAVKNMLCHAQYNVYDAKPTDVIDFQSFVMLYLNHRPAFGENLKMIKDAFKTFAMVRRGSLVVCRDEFIDMLCSQGECYTMYQAWYLLTTLCIHQIDERNLIMMEDFSFLPEEITFSEFILNILGIPDSDFLSEEFSCISSGSQQAGSQQSSDD